MEKEIYVSKKNLGELSKVFKTTRQTVWGALNFKTDSLLARKIRFTALREFGGVPSWKPALMETEFDTANNIMRQDFGNGVVLAVNLTTGEAILGIEKESLATGKREMEHIMTTASGLTIEGLMKLQGEAVKMSMSM